MPPMLPPPTPPAPPATRRTLRIVDIILIGGVRLIYGSCAGKIGQLIFSLYNTHHHHYPPGGAGLISDYLAGKKVSSEQEFRRPPKPFNWH